MQKEPLKGASDALEVRKEIVKACYISVEDWDQMMSYCKKINCDRCQF